MKEGETPASAGSGQQRNDERGAKPSENSSDSHTYHFQGTHYHLAVVTEKNAVFVGLFIPLLDFTHGFDDSFPLSKKMV